MYPLNLRLILAATVSMLPLARMVVDFAPLARRSRPVDAFREHAPAKGGGKNKSGKAIRRAHTPIRQPARRGNPKPVNLPTG